MTIYFPGIGTGLPRESDAVTIGGPSIFVFSTQWLLPHFDINGGAPVTISRYVTLYFKAISTVDDDTIPSQYRTKLDSGVWSSYADYVLNTSSSRKRGGSGMTVYDYDLGEDSYGEHTIELDIIDDKGNHLYLSASITYTAEVITEAAYEDPSRVGIQVKRGTMVDVVRVHIPVKRKYRM